MTISGQHTRKLIYIPPGMQTPVKFGICIVIALLPIQLINVAIIAGNVFVIIENILFRKVGFVVVQQVWVPTFFILFRQMAK